jgi:SNF2 family DNA or RNA helicase
MLSHEALSFHMIRDALKTVTWGAVFVDELGRFRRWSARTRTLLALKARRRVGFTGTLVVKSPSDVWYPCRFIKPGLFGISRKEVFDAEYCILGGYTGTEPIDVRPDREAQLNQHLDAVRITTDLADIRTMPPRTTTVRRVDLLPRQGQVYAELRDTLRLEIERTNDASFELRVNTYVARMQRLQEIAAGFARNLDGEIEYFPCAKTNELIELLEDDPQPTIVWTWWVPEREAVEHALYKAGILHALFVGRGRFLDGETDTLVLSLAQGAHGLNLDRATRMIYHSLPWDLDIMLQSQERNFRLTTTEPKEIVHLVTRGTVDTYVHGTVLRKGRVAQKFTRSSALAALGG